MDFSKNLVSKSICRKSPENEGGSRLRLIRSTILTLLLSHELRHCCQFGWTRNIPWLLDQIFVSLVSVISYVNCYVAHQKFSGNQFSSLPSNTTIRLGFISHFYSHRNHTAFWDTAQFPHLTFYINPAPCDICFLKLHLTVGKVETDNYCFERTTFRLHR